MSEYYKIHDTFYVTFRNHPGVYKLVPNHPNYEYVSDLIMRGSTILRPSHFEYTYDESSSFLTKINGDIFTDNRGNIFYKNVRIKSSTIEIIKLIRNQGDNGLALKRLLNRLLDYYCEYSERDKEDVLNAVEQADKVCNFIISNNTFFNCDRFKGCTIDPDGSIILYKKVTTDLYDLYTKSIPNFVGTTVSMLRNFVCSDPSSSCAYGLHVGVANYVRNFGGNDTVTLLVRVQPEDIITVPTDEHQKIRVCKYEVIGITDELGGVNEVDYHKFHGKYVPLKNQKILIYDDKSNFRVVK